MPSIENGFLFSLSLSHWLAPKCFPYRAIPVGAVSYMDIDGYRYKRDVLFCYDLKLPESFRPENQGGRNEAQPSSMLLSVPNLYLCHFSHSFDGCISVMNICFRLIPSDFPYTILSLCKWLFEWQMERWIASSWFLWHMQQMSYGEHNFSSQIALLSLLISCFDTGTALLNLDAHFLIFSINRLNKN